MGRGECKWGVGGGVKKGYGGPLEYEKKSARKYVARMRDWKDMRGKGFKRNCEGRAGGNILVGGEGGGGGEKEID